MSSGYRWLSALTVILSVVLTLGSTGLAADNQYATPDMLAIQGRWVRTDAPYVIELRQNKRNTLEATYFNRRFIHVETTETAVEKGLLYIMIRLQDTNYQGSTYLLRYDRDQDALHGVYTHGASGNRYQVSFSRKASG